MKKFMFFAVMAMTLGFMTSCLPGATYTTDLPIIDNIKHTIDGRQYDNETYRCWEITITTTETASGDFDDESVTASGTPEVEVEYQWGTEFGLRSIYEMARYLGNYSISGGSYASGGATATFKYEMKVVEGVDESQCNEDDIAEL